MARTKLRDTRAASWYLGISCGAGLATIAPEYGTALVVAGALLAAWSLIVARRP